MVLCLLLTVMYPASCIYQVFWHTVPSLVVAHSPARTLLLSVYSVLVIALAGFSFIAGLKLWLVKPDAVRFARRFLMTNLIANVAYFLFWMAVMRPSRPVSFAEMGWYHVVGPIAQTALWYFYLEHSKRVRTTYGLG
jgi:antibiotic biosynthesis monooxygenase (ABM) superfamily enzyme